MEKKPCVYHRTGTAKVFDWGLVHASVTQIIISSGDGLVPNRQQAITWTNDDTVHKGPGDAYVCNLTFPRYWPFVWGIHQSPLNSPHKGEWRVALMFSLICAWTNGWVNNREAGDLRCHRTHYEVDHCQCEPVMAKISNAIWRHQATIS